jgi:quercetin dioxygenase-like cupin family protein
MQKPVSVTNAQHYIWGEVCDGWHLVRSAGLSVIEERMPPGAQEQRHLHTRARQFFYVLAGELTLEIEGQVHRIAPGQGIEVAPGQGHQAANPANAGAEVRFLVISAPPAQGDRVPG